MKQYIIIFKELLKTVSLGKIIAHCCHVSGESSIETRCYVKDRYLKWMNDHQMTKVIVTASGKQREKFFDNMINNYTVKGEYIPFHGNVKDVQLGKEICWAIGPVTDEEAAKIGVKKLSLFKGVLK